MSNEQYLGAGPERQADAGEPVSRFRPRYRPLTEAERQLHDAIKNKAAELEALFEQAADLHFGKPDDFPELELGAFVELKSGRLDPAVEYFHDGMKALELAVMWTVKGLTSNRPVSSED